MAEITLITGGVRSGKSSYAEKLMLGQTGPHVYVATSPRLDGEMSERILKHQQRRAKYGWETVEEELDLAKVLLRNNGRTVLVECLTLWVNNLMYHATQRGEEMNEELMSSYCEELVGICRRNEGSIIFVTNETGLGIMPNNKEARRFGDLAGRCNQIIAAAATQVTMMVSGIPVPLKGQS